MLLVVAALLAAGPSPAIRHALEEHASAPDDVGAHPARALADEGDGAPDPHSPDDAEADEHDDAPGDDRGSEEPERAHSAAEFSITAIAGSRGEWRTEAIARASGRDLTLMLGAADFGGLTAPERQEAIFGAQSGVIRGDVRLVPQSGGLFRAGAELGVHFETVGLILGGRTAALGKTQLRGAGARLELESELTQGLRGGFSGSIWALQLDAPAPRSAWFRWGSTTLDWAQRWEAGLWLSREFGELFSMAAAFCVSQPAQPDTFEARGGLSLEVPLGAVKLRAESAVARQWPALWMMDLMVGVAMSVY